MLTSSLESLQGFASNFVWMFLGGTPTKFVQMGVLPLYYMELCVILWVFFGQFLKNFFYKITDQKSFIFGLESSQGVLFLVCSN